MSDSSDEQAVIRARQKDLYGAPLNALIDSFNEHLSLSTADVAHTIGVSHPMLVRLYEGQRSRLGNTVSVARLQMLREFTDHLVAGAASAADITLAVAQIAVATSPSADPGSGPTAVANPGNRQAGVIRADTLRETRSLLATHLRPSPTLRWPLLERFTGTETWVKHENHNPTGAFKVRGGLNYVSRLVSARASDASGDPSGDSIKGLISASRGNHSQSLAYAGRAFGVPVTVVMPEGNSADKVAATEAYGARVIIHGADFQESVEHARLLAEQDGLTMVPSYHRWLVEGVATYAAELHDAVPDLDVIYVPVGMGSGICANIAVRDLLGKDCEIVGVVAEQAPAYALSYAAGSVVTTATADTFVDGVACRTPDPTAVEIINRGAARIIQVSEDQAAEAMALAYRCTHNLAEPAGALALAGLLAERDLVAGRRVAIVHTGANTDFEVLARVLA